MIYLLYFILVVLATLVYLMPLICFIIIYRMISKDKSRNAVITCNKCIHHNDATGECNYGANKIGGNCRYTAGDDHCKYAESKQ